MSKTKLMELIEKGEMTGESFVFENRDDKPIKLENTYLFTPKELQAIIDEAYKMQKINCVVNMGTIGIEETQESKGLNAPPTSNRN